MSRYSSERKGNHDRLRLNDVYSQGDDNEAYYNDAAGVHRVCERVGRTATGQATGTLESNGPNVRGAAPSCIRSAFQLATTSPRAAAALTGSKYGWSCASLAVRRSWWSYLSSLSRKSMASFEMYLWFSLVMKRLHGLRW